MRSKWVDPRSGFVVRGGDRGTWLEGVEEPGRAGLGAGEA